MSELKQKSDFIVGLNHMASVAGYAILSGLVVYILVVVLGQFIMDITDMVQMIMNIIILVIVGVFVYRTGKQINDKYQYDSSKKVAFTSALSFLILNLLYIFIILFSGMSISGSVDTSMFETFLIVTGFNNIYTVITYLVFYSGYYFLAVKGLEVN